MCARIIAFRSIQHDRRKTALHLNNIRKLFGGVCYDNKSVTQTSAPLKNKGSKVIFTSLAEILTQNTNEHAFGIFSLGMRVYL